MKAAVVDIYIVSPEAVSLLYRLYRAFQAGVCSQGSLQVVNAVFAHGMTSLRLMSCRLLLPSFRLTEQFAEEVVDFILGKEGVGSDTESEATAACRAIECLMKNDAEIVAPLLMTRIEQLVDRRDADALSPADLRIFATPEGGPRNLSVLACRIAAQKATTTNSTLLFDCIEKVDILEQI